MRSGGCASIEACGGAGAKATIGLYRERATTRSRRAGRRGTHRAGRGRWLGARPGAWRRASADGSRSATSSATPFAWGAKALPVSSSRALQRAFRIRGAHGGARLRGRFPRGRQAAREPGAILRQKTLADTISQLAHAGLEDFYRGDVGREMAPILAAIGSAGDARGPRSLSARSNARRLSVDIAPGASSMRRRRRKGSPR